MTTRSKNSRVRVLVVEDHEPFRRHICSLLESYSHLRVIGTSDDGPKAVQQAIALQPDIILLDIGLPGINGLEAARQIRELCEQARIIFLTQESSPEVVDEAFSLGHWVTSSRQTPVPKYSLQYRPLQRANDFSVEDLSRQTLASQKHKQIRTYNPRRTHASAVCLKVRQWD